MCVQLLMDEILHDPVHLSHSNYGAITEGNLPARRMICKAFRQGGGVSGALH